jgi:hypothetical protein
MKVTELFENVVKVDFSKGRKVANDYWEKKAHQDMSDLEQEDERETLTVKELAEFEEWMIVAKKKGRVPGFDTMDDCIHYLIATLEIPQHITRHKAIQWFSSLSEEDREKARMIAHHADRMILIYEILTTKIHGIQDTWYKRFNGKPPMGWDAIEGAAWLDQEFSYDIAQLKALKKAITILGQ